jgi:hypothetical protein
LEPPVDQEPVTLPAEEPVPVSAEKSRVEDREKDFFGFETEGPEAAASNDFIGDAVEEITFDMEKPAETVDEAGQEASFIVPEPLKDEFPGTGETFPPETITPEQAEQGAQEQPPTSEFIEVSEIQTTEADIQPVAPQAEEESRTTVPEPPIQVPVPEEEPELSIELETEQPVETPAHDIPSEPGETEIKRLIEEKVEKIAWEVVPEMAEILIRETIEKIKSGS